MFFRRKAKERRVSEPPAEPTPPLPGPEEGRVSGAPTTQFLTGEAGKDRRNVQVLLEAIARVSGSRDLEELLTDIVDRSIEITGAERGLLLMKATKGKADAPLAVRVARLRGGRDLEEDARFSTSIANKVLMDVQAIRATVHSESEALELGRSVYDLKLRAVMCVPLAPGGREEVVALPSGVLYVDSRAATRQFSQGDLALFAALAQHISIALENARLHLDSLEKLRLEQSLELASAIQRDLMPEIPTNIPDWEIHGWYGPAEGAAADFYDFVKAKGGRLAIVVGDVTGHGIGPALITATAQASIRSYLRLISDPGEVVTLLNQDLCERIQDGRFLTLFLAVLDPDGTLHAVNGGHALPFVWRKATGDIQTVGRGGPALGMIPGEQYRAHEPIVLAPGDVVAIYTDGLSEARNPDQRERMLGEEGVQRVLAEWCGRGASSKDICLGLVEAAMQLSGGLREDDITVVTVRRL